MEPSKVHEVTREFLADHPGSQSALTELLALDQREGTWVFAQTNMDSGRFGELVSRGIVETVNDEYQIAHREAVRAALENDAFEPDSAESGSILPAISISLDFGAIGGLVGALAVVVIGRAWTYFSVFQQGYVVSPANDPYYYRYWQAQLLEISGGLADTSVIASLPGGARSRPYTHVVNWWLTELLGGTQTAADLVAAWLPVVGAAALGVVLYGIATTLTDDVRIGVVAVALLGVMPVHAVYTSLGFLEHRVHQYFWLGVLVFTLTWLAKRSNRREGSDSEIETIHDHLASPGTWVAVTLLALSVAVSPYPWAGSALIFIPVAVYIWGRVALDVREGVSPALANMPTTVAISVGGVVALYPHLNWGWHGSTAFLAYTPALVAVGAVAVVSVGELWHRFSLRASTLLGVETAVAAATLWLFTRVRPDQVGQIQSRAGRLLFREGITETVSLFSVEQYVIFGPLSQLGTAFYLAVVPLMWISWICIRRYQPEWLVSVVFGWYFLALATIQVRFAAHLALFISVFAAVSVVYILAAVDLISHPTVFESQGNSQVSTGNRLVSSRGKKAKRQDEDVISRVQSDPRWFLYVVGVSVLILSFNLIFAPGLVNQTTHSDAQVEAMTEIKQHADTTARKYPENFVLSRWGDNRMYNYFVSGESSGYGYAFRNYGPFRAAPSPDDEYRQLQDDTGYVVLTETETEAPANTTQTKLYQNFGAGEDTTGHFQLLYAGDGVRAFALVKGAEIRIDDVSADKATAATEVRLAGQVFEYSRSATPNGNSTATVRVAYPGEYQVENRTVIVSDSAVENGETVTTQVVQSETPQSTE